MNYLFRFFFFSGVGMMVRKLGNAVSPVVELTKSDDKYVLSSNSTFKNTSVSFKLNEEFDEETPDGRKVKSIFTQEGNKLLQTQKSDKVTTIVREFEPEQLKMVNLSKKSKIKKSNPPSKKKKNSLLIPLILEHVWQLNFITIIRIYYYDKMCYYFYRSWLSTTSLAPGSTNQSNN